MGTDEGWVHHCAAAEELGRPLGNTYQQYVTAASRTTSWTSHPAGPSVFVASSRFGRSESHPPLEYRGYFSS